MEDKVNESTAATTTTEKPPMDLNNWLPVTASRKAKWWYSAFHNVTAMVGAGVLGLPFAMSQLGCYSAIAFVASMFRGTHHHQHLRYGVRSHSTAGMIFDIFNALGTIAFAFAGHSVVLEIQATLPSTNEKPSKVPMWKGVIVAYLIVAFCYFSVAISGFWAFGDLVDDDVLVSLERPAWTIAIANLMVFAMPVFDMIESYLVQKLHFTPGRPLRLIGRSSYVVGTALVGICLPFFGGLLGFFGGLAFASTSYFIPCIMWLVLHRPKMWSFHWTASWISIIVGVLITVLAPIGGARSIIISAKTYKLFS
ncbi:hypothetical protein F0562_035124 [Nyssa sinensis]|uniref:Amino acid transporter transmembrane domain-containing protein n=1 Tax=Nyssa sinensis TaxID=561372 RepID=A0A5J5AEY2_9ASTE|nr:hypothetical protein F0562_035124 [Nyssa sinensis]